MGLTTLKNPKSPVAESYRNIRTNIEFSNVDKNLKTIMVTSSKQNEGKSTVISNLAASFAALEEKKVLIIDLDLRNPTVHRKFNVSNKEGVMEILLGQKTIEKCIKSVTYSNIEILTTGNIPANPAEVLGSKAMQELIENIKKDYDYVLIDTPPVGIVTDAAIISRYTDGTILIVASKEVDVEHVKVAKDRLEKVNAKILGCILNKFEEEQSPYGYYGYYNQEEKVNSHAKPKKKFKLGFNLTK